MFLPTDMGVGVGCGLSGAVMGGVHRMAPGYALDRNLCHYHDQDHSLVYPSRYHWGAPGDRVWTDLLPALLSATTSG